MACVLLVEDNPANLELMTYLLKTFGHTVVATHDGAEGLAAVLGQPPDLIVCDIHLPKMNGYEFAHRVKHEERLRAIPLVAVTALAMVGDRDKVLAAGFDGYISKPIAPESFVSQVEAFLRQPLRGTSPEPRPTAAGDAPALPAVIPTNGVRILVVDDSSVNHDLIGSTLEPSGYTLVHASNGAEALAAAQQLCPDIILSDLHMSGSSGLELLSEVKADPRLCRIPFLFISSSTFSAAERSAALKLGATRFILRPIEPAALLATIEICLAERRER